MRSLLGIVKEIKFIVKDTKLKVDDKDILNTAKDVYLSQYKEQLKYFINSAYGTRNFVNNALKGGFTYADTDSIKFTAMNESDIKEPDTFKFKDGTVVELFIGDIVLDDDFLVFYNGQFKGTPYFTSHVSSIGKTYIEDDNRPQGYAFGIDKVNYNFKLIYSPTREGVTLK